MGEARSIDELKALASELDELYEKREGNRLARYMPYLKQMEFHSLGASRSERLLKAGNQLGKTYCGAAEAAFHLTGLYPEWWTGRRWSRPVRMWIGGESAGVVRDTTQKLLLGDLAANRDNLGTGLIPRANLPEQPNWSRGVDSGVDNIVVKHKSGGNSIIIFKSYEQGRVKWQGDTIDIIWFDEEPPPDIYSEGLTRLTATDGMAFMTFTPLKGMSTVVRRFLSEESPQRAVVNMTMDDAPHMTPEMQEKALARYPEHERATRARGDVMMGEGRIFNIAEERIVCEPFQIPTYWKHIVGMDIGTGQSENAHPTAVIWLVENPDTGDLYVYGEYRTRGGALANHASAIRARGRIPVAWPPDALQGDKFSGKKVAEHYKNEGCFMLSTHAQFPDGNVSVWAGVTEIQNYMEAGKFKVFRHCTMLLEEIRNYHTKVNPVTGRTEIVKLMDDLICAVRYAVMMRRYARPVDNSWRMGVKQKIQRVADGVDYNPLE